MEDTKSWGITFDMHKIDRFYVRSNTDSMTDKYLKEYNSASKLDTIFKEDKLLSSQDLLKQLGGASVYVEMKDQPYQIIGVHNGTS